MNKQIKIKKYRNISIIILAFILTTIASIFFSNSANAMVKWQGSATSGRPTFSIENSTGLFPQILNNRIITAPNNRYDLGTNSWTANMTSGTVYCQDQGLILRNGKFDPKTYYFNGESNILGGVTYDNFKKIIEGYVVGEGIAYAEENNWSNIKSTMIDFGIRGNINISERFYFKNDSSENWATKITGSILSILSGEQKPPPYSADIDSAIIYHEWDGDPKYGPQVCVMETSVGAQDGYKLSNSGTYISKEGGENARAAYILTVLENMYGETDSKKYNEEDMQTAYWMLKDKTGYKDSKLTQNGKELFRKSEEYEKFINETKNGYKASIDNSNAKVIANRDSKEYVVGPFKLYYPDYTDISYVKSMHITTNTGKKLVIDEKNQDFSLILSSDGTTGSNGITKKYPKSGENFFIKFSAEKAGYADSIDLYAGFEFINDISIQYNELRSKANIYRYMGHIEESGKYAKNFGEVYATARVTGETTEHYPAVPAEHSSNCRNDIDGICTCGAKDTPARDETKPHSKDIIYSEIPERKEFTTVEQPFVKMDEEPESVDTAQPLVIALDGARQYNKIEKSTHIDLTMELGGKVWEDSTGGKETIGNNIKDNSDKPMPNVVVTLYKQDGSKIGTTKTDSNGSYLFSNLNAMYQYYVKFTYNGQYYQPVTYTPSNTWGSSNWSANSNGTDKRNERLDYNAKFSSIGSSPANYKGEAGYNETFTKMELLGYTLQTNGEYTKTREAVIDDYGNLILGSSSDEKTKKMIQFVKDCQIDSYTGKGDGSYDLYPVPAVFVIDNVFPLYRELLGWNISVLYDSAYYINQGYVQREKSDLAIKKDIDNVTLEINGQTHKYTYDTLENASNKEDTWDINVRLSDAYYNANYSRELYKSDYLYKVSSYGDYAAYGKNKSDELEVFVTYKIMVRNQSQSIRCKVDEIVDYYDQDYEYVAERSYAQIKVGDNKGIYNTKATTTSKYESQSASTRTKIEGYDNLYVQGLDEVYLSSGQTAYVYLTFRIKKDTIDGEDWVKLDENVQTAETIGVGKENIAEINGYSTLYKDKTVIPNVGAVSGNEKAGIIDKDSNPGNLKPSDVPKDGTIKHENFEDDTDKAPNIKIKLYRDDNTNRVIAGTVWEDERNETIGATTTGDGIRKDNETLINGVTVQLVELMDNGTEYIWREFGDNSNSGGATNTIGKGTGSGTQKTETPIINKFNLVQNYNFDDKHDGDYAFKSFIPGKYVVRFIYGDTEKTVLTKDISTSVNGTLGKTGLNEKSYNGQDYKSTTYQEGINQNKAYVWRERSTWANGQETLGKIIRQILAYDKNVCTQNEILTYLYDITESDKLNNVSDAKDIESNRNKVIDYSDNDVVNHIAEVLASHRELPIYPNGSYTKEQLQSLINELIDKTKMTSETGTMVIELEYDRTGTGNQVIDNKSSYAINNVDLGLEERAKAQLAINKDVTNVKVTLANGTILFDAKSSATNVLWKDHKSYEVGYKGNFMDPDKFGNIVNIRNKNKNKFGLIQLSMDEELMHGATIEISYNVTVSNVGEVDYKDNRFYYTGNVSDTNTIVTTRANQVIDYVANNLQFNVANNKNWKVITKEDLLAKGLVNTGLTKQIEQYNTIIVTESLGSSLVPNLYKEKVQKNAIDSVTIPLVLTQLITSENETDDLTYRNIVEVAKISNTVGRKNEYSVVGNQDPTKDPQEIDSDKAEIVKILPPFGNAGIYIIIAIITIASIAVLTVGIIFIKKKVLK